MPQKCYHWIDVIERPPTSLDFSVDKEQETMRVFRYILKNKTSDQPFPQLCLLSNKDVYHRTFPTPQFEHGFCGST